MKMTGDVDQLMRAVALVVTKLSENPDYHLLTDANLTYTQRGGYLPGGGPYPQSQGVAPPGPGTGGVSVTLPVPEDKVGVVIGKQGQVRGARLAHARVGAGSAPSCWSLTACSERRAAAGPAGPKT